MYKKGETTEIGNYRPVLLLIAVSEVLEIKVFKRLEQQLKSNNIQAIEQFGFRKVNIESSDFTLTDNIFLTRSVTSSVT